jgi:hypothetical protein
MEKWKPLSQRAGGHQEKDRWEGKKGKRIF